MKFTQIKVFFTLPLILTVASCTTSNAPYLDRTPGPKAQIQNSSNLMIFQNAEHCAFAHRLKGRSWFDSDIGYTNVPANKLVTLAGAYQGNRYYCVFSFTPDADNQYKVNYKPTEKSTCAVTVYNTTQQKNVLVVVMRHYQRGVMSGHC